MILVGSSQRHHLLHPAHEAAAIKRRRETREGGEEDEPLRRARSVSLARSLSIGSKMLALGAHAKHEVDGRNPDEDAPPSPLSKMAFAAFEGIRPEHEHAPPRPLDKAERGEVVGAAQHFMKYALGVYGWMLYAYRKAGPCLLQAPCQMCTLCPCFQREHYEQTLGPRCGCCPTEAVGYRDDRCCRFDNTALLRTVWEFGGGGAPTAESMRAPPRSEARVVYASWTNTLLVKPYAISIDRRRRVVVVSIRGTLSINDVVTDVLAGDMDLTSVTSPRRPPMPSASRGTGTLLDRVRSDSGMEPLRGATSAPTGRARVQTISQPKPGGEYFAHEGIFRAAAAIEADLDRHGLLRQLLIDGKVTASDAVSVDIDQDWQDCRSFGLVLTGHSLGAGTAALLAMLLRPFYQERLHCWAFSPPGGLLSHDAVQHTEDYVTSVVVGHDIIPRLSIRTMEQLRDHALDLLMLAPNKKCDIFCTEGCSAIYKLCCRKRRDAKQKKHVSAQRAARKKQLETAALSVLTRTDRVAKTPPADEKYRISPAEVAAVLETEDRRRATEHAAGTKKNSKRRLDRGGGLPSLQSAEAKEWVEQRESRLSSEQSNEERVTHSRRMYLPGRVLHLTPNDKYGAHFSHGEPAGGVEDGAQSSHQHTPWWTEDRDTFQEVLVSHSMFVDHMPDRVMAALQGVGVASAPPIARWVSADRKADSGGGRARCGSNARERVAAVFRNADADSNGGLTQAEVRQMLGTHGFDELEQEWLDSVMGSFDVDGDGSLSSTEFATFYRTLASKSRRCCFDA